MSLNGVVIDPVCGMEFDEVNAAASIEWRGRTQWFCTDACKDDFEKEPGRYDTVGRLVVQPVRSESLVALAAIR